jgi:uncharacterized protein YabN with tetrapyrrole methylase and pyrophosphatase domain
MNPYKKVIEYYGKTAQLEKATEELEELKVELWEWMNSNSNRDRVVSEIADVQNMIHQLSIIYDISLKELFDAMDLKMKRTLQRIEIEQEQSGKDLNVPSKNDTPPYSNEDFEDAKSKGLNLDDWKDYVEYYGVGEREGEGE